ncbi:MAG: hypothetical protein JWO36_7094 [Myxococcales bacterium]|nr:hypothetical protein [Myxococcales bacterium]
MAKGQVLRAGWKQDRYVVELDCHPVAPQVVLSVEPDGELTVSGETSGIGPGYHADVLARLAPLLDELDYVWTDPEDDVPAAMCRWLAGELAADQQIKLGAVREFVIDAPVLTMLGPRDAAWRDAVLADPQRGADAFAWWHTGPGQAARSRALLAMWHEVPWREPLDKAERELMTRVDDDLRAARKADRELELPWAEWVELLDHLGDREDEEARARAAGLTPVIGYRRHDLIVELSGGWVVQLGGGFVGAWEDDGARYWSTDGDRAIEVTTLTANEEQDSQRLLDVAPEHHPVIERMSDGARRGRAEAYIDDGVHVVHGLMASAPHVAIITCKGSAQDQAWALATWRSLRQR